MGLKLQGLASKIGKLDHDLETDAEELDKAIDQAQAKRQQVMPKAKTKIAAHMAHVADVNTVLDQIDAASNGGPDLEDQPNVTPLPQVRGYPA